MADPKPRTLKDGRRVEWVSGVWAGPMLPDGSRQAAVTIRVDGVLETREVMMTAAEILEAAGMGFVEDGAHRRAGIGGRDG